mmetsp:Transcript_52364/g.60138  ORF Transcript_52364/g.60138 Transcript_52364/m.60138 type:complete len:289 (+) Transcript_52364:25-891(+)
MAVPSSLVLSISGGTIEALDASGVNRAEEYGLSKLSVKEAVAAAREAFDASHVFLINPSVRTAIRNWFMKSMLLSAPVTALVGCAYYAVAARYFRSTSDVGLLSAAVAGTAAIVTQSVGWYALIRHLFLDHLANDDGPFKHPEYFIMPAEGTEQQYLFAAAVPNAKKGSDGPLAQDWSIVGSTVLLTGKIADGSHHPLVRDEFDGKPIGIIRTVGVAPECHGLGLGGSMLRAAISKARALGLKELVLCTTVAMVNARGMYEKYGFVLEARHTEMAAIGYDLFIYRMKL